MRTLFAPEKKPRSPIPFANGGDIEQEFARSDVGRAVVAERTAAILAQRRAARDTITAIESGNQVPTLTQELEILQADYRRRSADLLALGQQIVQLGIARSRESDRVSREIGACRRVLAESEPTCIREFCDDMERRRSAAQDQLKIVARGSTLLNMVTLRRRDAALHSNRAAIEAVVAATFQAEHRARELVYAVDDVNLETALAALRATIPVVDLDRVEPYDAA
jgi:hypothetical protein